MMTGTSRKVGLRFGGLVKIISIAVKKDRAAIPKQNAGVKVRGN
jgi:hypothetical protein